MKTIKQIADELGVDKQKVYRYIKKNHINEVHQKDGVMYYDETAESLINHYFQEITASIEAHQSTSKTTNDAVIDVLKETINTLQLQLEVKDKQISELSEALVNTTKSLEASHALHAGTIHSQKQLTGMTLESAEELPTVTEELLNLSFIDRVKRFFK